MISIALTLLAVSPLFVSGIPVAFDQNSAQACGVFAASNLGFDTDSTLFALTAFPPTEQDPTTGGINLDIGSLTADSNPVLLASATIERPFNLTSGTIFVPDPEADLFFTAALLTDGSDVSFTPTEGAPLNIPQFCAIPDTDPEQGSPFPSLAVNGSLGDFALCESSVSAGTQIVVFRPASGNSAYDVSTCASVNILLTTPAL